MDVDSSAREDHREVECFATQVLCNLCGDGTARQRFPATDQGRDRSSAAVFACTSGGHGAHGPLVECCECGLVYAHPLPSEELLAEVYSSTQDTLYLEEEAYRIQNFKPLLRVVEKGRARGSLLDVGCHIGTFLGLAAESGWNVTGIEPSSWAADVASSRGLDVHCGSLENSSPGSDFDLITMWDVLEHFSDPLRELRRAHELLRPGGSILLTTIDIGSLFARILGARWPWLMHMHLYYFTHETLRRYLARAGFEEITLRACSRTVSLGYATYKAGLTFGVGTKLLARGLEASRVGRIAVPLKLGDIVLAEAKRP